MSCIVRGCFNTKRYERELSFFCLPKNRELAQEWLRILGRLDITDNEHKIYKICSEHFKESDYTKLYPRKLLNHQAVPSPNLHHSQSDYANIISRTNKQNLQHDLSPMPARDVENFRAPARIKTYLKTPTNATQSSDITAFNAKTTRPNFNQNKMKRKNIDLKHRSNGATIDISFINIDERLKLTQKNGIDYYKRYCKAKSTISHLRSKLKAQSRFREKLILEDVNLDILLKQCRSLLSDGVFSLFENELYVALNKGKHPHAYSKAVRLFCLELYKASPKAYSILRNTLSLPQKSTIKQWQSSSKKWETGNRDGSATDQIKSEYCDEQCDKYYEEVQYLDEDILGDDVLKSEVGYFSS